MTRSFRFGPVVAGLSLLAALLPGGSVAHAEPSAADRESARALMKEGDAAAEKKEWAVARKAYGEAHRLMGLPSTGRELSRAEEALGHFLEAKDACEMVARSKPSAGEPAPFEAARKECQGVVAALDKRIATLRIEVKGAGADASKIGLDGASIPGPSTLRRANPGEHEVTATNAAGAVVKQVVKVGDGETKDVVLDLANATGAAAPLTAPSPSTSAVGSASTAPPPAAPPPAAPPPAPSSHTTAYVMLGVGGAALVAGGVFGALALSDYGKAKDACPTKVGCSPSAIDSRDAAGTKAWIANGGLGLGVVLGAVGTYLLVSGPSQPTTARAWKLEPAVSVTTAGANASVGGTF
jgi:hypothetical protein